MKSNSASEKTMGKVSSIMNSSSAKAMGRGVVTAALSISAGLAMDVSQSNPCLAQDAATPASSCSIDWSKLNLTSSQNSQIQQLEQAWYKDSGELIPQIREEQVKLQRAIADHNADSMTVMALQQSVARKREQLNSLAMQSFLNKKKVLDSAQKKQLEDMFRQAVQNRKSQLYPGSQTEVMPDKIQNLMQRVRSIWPDNSDH